MGVFQSTDRCCRQHDNCPDSIAAGASKHGLRNTGTFTRLATLRRIALHAGLVVGDVRCGSNGARGRSKGRIRAPSALRPSAPR